MYVIGTAGHVDHGKSTLVRALTGIDPDRLAEEKQRGMTIDLGFAWLTLPSGREVSLVDVPGHERFIKNMLAGVGGMDLALLIVAADESVMPQTREHLAILDLLGVKRAICVITKADLADADTLELVGLEVEDLLAGTGLSGARVLPVSAVSGQGIPELLDSIDAALTQEAARRDVGRPRLPVDRVFTIAGFGTVVTGTLVDGSLSVGQEVELVPSGQRSRIRGLQSHRKSIEMAGPGNRVAVNLSGISPEQVARGEVLTTPGWLRATRAVDARIHALPGAARPLPHNQRVSFHAFAAEAPARVRLLEADALEPGQEAWAQVWLEAPVALARGDRFVLRSTDETLGGGVVVDVDAPRHRRRHAPTIERLERIAKGSPTVALLTALEGRGPTPVAELARRTNLGVDEALALGAEAIAEGSAVPLGDGVLTGATVLLTAGEWTRIAAKAQAAVAAFHAASPLRAGMTREELRSRLGLAGNATQAAIARLVADGTLAGEGALVRLPEHSVALSPAQQGQMNAYLAALEAQDFPTETPAIAPELAALLAEQGRIVRAGQGVVFAAANYQRLAEAIIALARRDGSVTVAGVRDALGASRRYALALLEHLDERKVTRRQGDERVLLEG